MLRVYLTKGVNIMSTPKNSDLVIVYDADNYVVGQMYYQTFVSLYGGNADYTFVESYLNT